MASLIYKQELFVLAPVSRVWDALINPDITPQYMHGCQAISDWVPGNPLVWRGIDNGVEYVKGTVISFIPEKELSYTVFDPNAGYADDPVNYLTTTFTLHPEENGTRVMVSQEDYATVENGEKRFQETGISWEMTLNAFKRTLED